MLNPATFQKTIKHLKFKPDVDGFTSRLNTQLPKYICYKPDPYACLTNAFSVHWVFYKCYLFPPLSLIAWIRMDQTEVILVVGNSALANSLQGKLPQEPYLVTSHKENPLLPKNPRGTAGKVSGKCQVSGKCSWVKALIMIRLTF